jgi:pimeloyl-ACP methyl ester carboxylesterase
MRVSWRRLIAAALLLAAVSPVALAAGERTTSGRPCGRTPGLTCLTVTVPLDRAGRVPGTVGLHVEVLPAEPSRGVFFLVAGGPGQGSADVFDLGSRSSADDFHDVFPGWTLVAVDGRGTGRSGPLHCPMLNPLRLDAASLATACAKRLGVRRDFYGTADQAEDIDAVRSALGYDSIALYGVSYGTKLALSYALAHPDHVERLLLDSVALPEGDNPYLTDFFAQLPKTLARFCAGGSCRGVTRNLVGDVATVANGLATRPARGTVTGPSGSRHTERLGGLEFLSLVVEADLNPAIAALLPAVTHAAREGDPAPLLRLYDIAKDAQAGMYPSVNLALFMATTCRDGPFPWTPDTPLAARPGIVAAALAALPARAMGPFDHWAGRTGNAESCVGWPSPKGGAEPGSGPLPDVPVLALSGDLDLRTPTADAAAAVARFRQGHLLVAPGSGHSVLGNDVSGCIESAVVEWLAARPVPRRCTPQRPYLAPVEAYPENTPPPTVPTPATPKRTLKLVQQTLREAEAIWLLLWLNDGHRAAGLHGGTLTSHDESFELSHYALVPGVEVSGKVEMGDSGPPLTFSGVIAVEGDVGANGTVALHSNGRLEGMLGGELFGR